MNLFLGSEIFQISFIAFLFHLSVVKRRLVTRVYIIILFFI